VEKSFLARWGLVLNVSKFPLDAKAPALSDSLRGNARSDFNVQGRLVLVSPVAVNQIVQAFPDSNARAFLSAATSQLLQIPNDSKEKGSLFLVVPANEATTNSLANSQRSFGGWEATGRDNGKIEDYIRSSMVSVPVDNRIYGKLHLLSLMVDSYRTSVYESLVEAMSQHEQFAGSRERTHGVLAPMLLAITSNFISNSYLQLKRIKNLDPADFIASNSKVFDFIERKLQQAEFYKIVNAMPDELSSLSDVPFRTRLNPTETWNSFMDERSDYFVDRTRYTVVSEMTGKVNQVLTEYLNQIARVNSVYRLPTSEEWLDALKDTDQKEEFFSLGSRLADLYLEFWSSMYDMQLVENRTSVNDYRPGIYDIARLFTLVIDQAISKMPWGTMTKFMLKNLTLTTSDMEIGQRFGVQHYLFVSKNSLLKPATHELLLQMTTGSQSYKYLGDRRRQEYETQFLENISNMFVPVSSSSSPGPVQKDAI